jgi:hypothetical protein
LKWQTRKSVVQAYDFNDTIVGLEAQWHWKEM